MVGGATRRHKAPDASCRNSKICYGSLTVITAIHTPADPTRRTMRGDGYSFQTMDCAENVYVL